ncbi:pre-peptidase C-terminal domain-containing protein [Dyella kyungheensis]|uniref:pre-peptidase C-terminal domain-containing protein n=1 Tax=Dyella kyungheensis TaxID=1242174 RepID=UPI003CE869E3
MSTGPVQCKTAGAHSAPMRARRFLVVKLTTLACAVAFGLGDVGEAAAATSSSATSQYLKGDAAVSALGGSLPQLAASYGMTPAQLTEKLEHDPTLNVTPDGRLIYLEAASANAPAPAPARLMPRSSLAAFSAPPTNVFALHSRPSSKKVIYLNFQGGTVTFPPANISTVYPPFDMDGDSTTFSTSEQQQIQEIFQRVAEEFAPFDIDVTTENPPQDALVRSSASDDTYGVEVFITKDVNHYGSGGTAPIGTFDQILPAGVSYDMHRYSDSAYVFYDNLGNNIPGIAMSISHEVGHTLGLSHQSYQSPTGAFVEYWPGDGRTNFVPIMSQIPWGTRTFFTWYNGAYQYATNSEDEIAIMQTHGARLVPDDYGSTIATAFALPDGTLNSTTGRTDVAVGGLINSNTDSDFFKFTTASRGPLNIEVDPVSVGANLDAKLSLFDSSGALLAVAKDKPLVNDPLSASISVAQAPAGTYFVKVEGTGRGSPMVVDPAVGLTWGYTNYGSLGHYTLTVSKPTPAQLAMACTPSKDLSLTSPAPTQLAFNCQVWSNSPKLTATFDWGDAQSPWNVSTATVYLGSWVGPAPDGATYANQAWVPGRVYQYDEPGTYNVNVTMKDANGSTATQSVIFKVGEPMPVNFEITQKVPPPYKAPTGVVLEFTPLAITAGYKYPDYCLWNFGDGTPAVKGPCGQHVGYYTKPGTYVASVTAAFNQYSTTLTRQITVQIQ